MKVSSILVVLFLLSGCQQADQTTANKTIGVDQAIITVDKLLEKSNERAKFRLAISFLYNSFDQCPSNTPEIFFEEENAIRKKEQDLKKKIRNIDFMKVDIDFLQQEAARIDATAHFAECAEPQERVLTTEEIQNYRKNYIRQNEHLDKVDSQIRKFRKVLEN